MRMGGFVAAAQQSPKTRFHSGIRAKTLATGRDYRVYPGSACRSRSAMIGIIPMKKIVLSFAAVALLAGFAAGCAKDEPKPAPSVVRKG